MFIASSLEFGCHVGWHVGCQMYFLMLDFCSYKPSYESSEELLGEVEPNEFGAVLMWLQITMLTKRLNKLEWREPSYVNRIFWVEFIVGVSNGHDRGLIESTLWSSNRVIDHDCALGLLEHDPIIERWVTCEYRVACHFYCKREIWNPRRVDFSVAQRKLSGGEWSIMIAFMLHLDNSWTDRLSREFGGCNHSMERPGWERRFGVRLRSCRLVNMCANGRWWKEPLEVLFIDYSSLLTTRMAPLHHLRNCLTRQLIVCMAVYTHTYQFKSACNTSILTGKAFMNELIHCHLAPFFDTFRMPITTFQDLCTWLRRKKFLIAQSKSWMSLDQMVDIFL